MTNLSMTNENENGEGSEQSEKCSLADYVCSEWGPSDLVIREWFSDEDSFPVWKLGEFVHRVEHRDIQGEWCGEPIEGAPHITRVWAEDLPDFEPFYIIGIFEGMSLAKAE